MAPRNGGALTRWHPAALRPPGPNKHVAGFRSCSRRRPAQEATCLLPHRKLLNKNEAAMHGFAHKQSWLPTSSKQVAVSAFTPQCVFQHNLSYLRAAERQSRSHQNILGVQSSRLREPLYVVLVAVCFSRDKRLSLLVTRESSAEAPKHVKQ